MNSQWMFLGGVGAVLAMVASCWSQVHAVCTQILSYVIVTYEVAGVGAHATLMHLRQHYHASRFGVRTFYAFRAYVRPHQRFEWVCSEFLGNGAQVFWRGWRPIWVSRKTEEDRKSSESRMYSPIHITCFRGTLDINQFMNDAIEHFNRFDDDDETRRYQIHHITGTDGKSTIVQSGPGCSPNTTNKTVDCEYRAHKLIRWTHNDLGPDVTNSGHSINRLALCPAAEGMVEEIRGWLGSEDWHRERGIPWKHGYLLVGPPGNGKTALIRAIAQDFDLPAYVYDLATLHNDELRSSWTEMLCRTPCIALIEDIDSVFNGRENERGRLSFDCLLNCLDGIDNTDGLLVFITTNHPEKLDPAIGGGASRPGRVDRVVVMTTPDVEGRWHIANRIMADCTIDQRQAAVESGATDSGAQFELRCRSQALSHHYATTANMAG